MTPFSIPQSNLPPPQLLRRFPLTGATLGKAPTYGSIPSGYRRPVRSASIPLHRKSAAPSDKVYIWLEVENPPVCSPKERARRRPAKAIAIASPELAVPHSSRTAAHGVPGNTNGGFSTLAAVSVSPF